MRVPSRRQPPVSLPSPLFLSLLASNAEFIQTVVQVARQRHVVHGKGRGLGSGAVAGPVPQVTSGGGLDGFGFLGSVLVSRRGSRPDQHAGATGL